MTSGIAALAFLFMMFASANMRIRNPFPAVLLTFSAFLLQGVSLALAVSNLNTNKLALEALGSTPKFGLGLYLSGVSAACCAVSCFFAWVGLKKSRSYKHETQVF